MTWIPTILVRGSALPLMSSATKKRSFAAVTVSFITVSFRPVGVPRRLTLSRPRASTFLTYLVSVIVRPGWAVLLFRLIRQPLTDAERLPNLLLSVILRQLRRSNGRLMFNKT